MAVFNCKMCGAALDVTGLSSVIQCAYCGTSQTLPKLTDDKRAALYDKANLYRRNNDFDKAAKVYEQILEEDSTDAEAYWSLVLCRYGIEYVEDPVSKKRVPTVNRIQYTSIYDNSDYQLALENADPIQSRIYKEEAYTINEIQKGFLEISQKEKPFDVFICYKETGADGRRTQDSVLAQELYYELTELGYKVFFARITLENKLGTAYEPYIFAALNSSKVMVVLGTKPEHFNAVWVKNEWSRFLALIKEGNKKVLIPAYRDMNPYYLPEEFSHLQAQDMSKLGFMQDLVHGIKKLAGNTTEETNEDKNTANLNPSVATLLKRVQIFLEGDNFVEANEYCEKILDLDPENGTAYLYKLLAQLHLRSEQDLQFEDRPLDEFASYKNALRFSDEDTAARLRRYNDMSKSNHKRQIDHEREEEERRRRKIRQEEDDERRRIEQLDFEQKMREINYRRSSIEKIRNKKLIWAILWVFMCWPVSIPFFIKYGRLGKQISNLYKDL